METEGILHILCTESIAWLIHIYSLHGHKSSLISIVGTIPCLWSLKVFSQAEENKKKVYAKDKGYQL